MDHQVSVILKVTTVDHCINIEDPLHVPILLRVKRPLQSLSQKLSLRLDKGNQELILITSLHMDSRNLNDIDVLRNLSLSSNILDHLLMSQSLYHRIPAK